MDKGNELFRSYVSGDEQSFRELVLLYKDSLIFFINRYVRNLSCAEEIAEDSFVELLLHKDRFNFKYSVKTYLYTIGRNMALNHLKKLSRRRTESINGLEYTLADEEELESKVLENETKKAVNACLMRINPDYRTVLYLVYFEQMDTDGCMRVMKKSRKQIENLLYRGKEALRKELGKEGIGDEIR